MRSNTWRALFLLSLTLILVSTAMDAQAARRSSLAGNQFINDPDDMFAFPQLTHKYKNRVIFDLGQGGDEGSGSIVFGNNSGGTSTPVVACTRTPPAGPGVGRTGIPWDSRTLTTSGGTLAWPSISARRRSVSGSTGPTDSNKQVPSGQTEPDFEDSESMFGIQLGTTLGSVQLAAEIGFGSYSDKTPGLDPADQYDYSMSLITLLARGDIEDFGGLDWRWIAAFSTGSTSYKAEGVPNDSATAFRGSFGPVWGTPGEWEVAAYMSFDYMS